MIFRCLLELDFSAPEYWTREIAEGQDPRQFFLEADRRIPASRFMDWNLPYSNVPNAGVLLAVFRFS